MTKYHGFWNRRNVFPMLDLDGGYTVNIYPFVIALLSKKKKTKGEEPCTGYVSTPRSPLI